jgi:DNA-binding HxlR family transcriptional regulator
VATRSDRSARSTGLVEAVGRVGDRWSLLIVDALLDGSQRFGELQQAVVGVAPNILSARLKQLEREGLVVSRPYSRRPVRLDYELTEQGHDLAGALRLLASWGAASAPEHHRSRHAACGGALDVRWWCASCREPVDPDTDQLHWV